MLWRALLAAVAISYLICVLFLSGIQKEDLDVSLLKKLQRHNVDLDDFTNEKLRNECLNNSDNKPKEEIDDDKVQEGPELISTESSTHKLDTTELETVLIYLKNRKRSQTPSAYEHSDNKDANNMKTQKKHFFDITVSRNNNVTAQQKSETSMETRIKTYLKLFEDSVPSNQGTETNSFIEVTTQTNHEVSNNNSEYNDDQVRKLLAEYLTKKLKLIDQMTKAVHSENVTKKNQPTTKKPVIARNNVSKPPIVVSTTSKIEENVITSRSHQKQQYVLETTTTPKQNYLPQTQQHLAEGIVILTRKSLEGISDNLRNGELHSATYTENSHNVLTYNLKKPDDLIQTTKSRETSKNNHSHIEDLHAEIKYEYEKDPATLMLDVQNNDGTFQNDPQIQHPTTAESYQTRGYQPAYHPKKSQNLFIKFNNNGGRQQEFEGHVASIQIETDDIKQHSQLQDTLKPISIENRSPVIRIQREPDRNIQNNDDRQFQTNFHPQISQDHVMDHRPRKLDDNGDARRYYEKNLSLESKQVHFQNLQDTIESHHLETEKQVQNSDDKYFQQTAQSENGRESTGNHNLHIMDSTEVRGYRDRNLPPEFIQHIISAPKNFHYRNGDHHLEGHQHNLQVPNNHDRQYQPTEIQPQRIASNPTKLECSREHTTEGDKILSAELIQQIAENVKQLVLKDLKKELITSTLKVSSASETQGTTTASPITTVTQPTTTMETTTTKTTTTLKSTTNPPTTTTMRTTTSTPFSTSTTKPTVVTALPVSIDLNNVQVATKAIEKIIELFEKFKIVRDKGEEYKQTINKISDQVPSKPQYHVPVAMPAPLPAVSQYREKITSVNSAPVVVQQYVPLPAAQAEIAPSFIPHTLDTIDLMTGMNQHPKEMPHISEPVMIQTNVNEIRPLAIQMKKPDPLNVNIVLTTENPYWRMKERERWNFMLQYNKTPEKETGIKNVNNIKTTYANYLITSTTPGNRFVNTEDINAIKNREKWLNSTLEAFDKSLQLSLMKELGNYNHKTDESFRFTNNKNSQYNDLLQKKYITNTGISYNNIINQKYQPTEKYLVPPMAKSVSTPLLNFNFNNFNVSHPEESYANAIVKKFESKLDDTVKKLNTIAKLKSLYKIPDVTPSLSDYDRIKIDNPIIVTDLNTLYKYRTPETINYDHSAFGNIFGHPGNIKDFGIDKTIENRKLSLDQLSNMNALLNRNIDKPDAFLHVNPEHNNEINLAALKNEPLFNIPYPHSPLIDSMKSRDKYSDIPLFSHDLQNKNVYVDNANQIYSKYQYLGNKFSTRDEITKDNKYELTPAQIEALFSNLSSREKEIKNLKNKPLDYNVPKYKNVYDSHIYSPPNKMDNVRLKFENRDNIRDKYYQSREAPVKKSTSGKPYVSPYIIGTNMNSRFKSKIVEAEPSHHREENIWYKNKEKRNENGNRGHMLPTVLGKGTRPRPTSEVGAERPNYAYHEYKPRSETDRKPELEKFNMDIKEYSNTGMHNNPEDDLPMSPSECGNDEHCIMKVVSRLQIPITKIKTGKYDDRNFKDFLKTQQKVNRMLETILAAKTDKLSAETL